MAPINEVKIMDIRRNDFQDSLVSEIYNGLQNKDGSERILPTLLLYNATGLRLFEDITYVDEYYLTNAEIQVLTDHAKTIAENVPDNMQILELGSGCVISLPI